MNDVEEIWRAIPGFEGVYEVSDQGRVRSLPRFITICSAIKGTYTQFRRGCLLRPQKHPGGYQQVNLGQEEGARLVHALVLLAFVGPCPPGHEVAHFPDRDKKNNRLRNLRYALPIDNANDRRKHGTTRPGIENSQARLTEKDVLEIRRLAGAITQRELGEIYGVAQGHISRIVRREEWRHV